jgi:hypothetical protein
MVPVQLGSSFCILLSVGYLGSKVSQADLTQTLQQIEVRGNCINHLAPRCVYLWDTCHVSDHVFRYSVLYGCCRACFFLSFLLLELLDFTSLVLTLEFFPGHAFRGIPNAE